jgi:hypothetical protein
MSTQRKKKAKVPFTVKILHPPSKVGAHRIVLDYGQALQDPTSTKDRLLMGPAVWIWTVHPDGGIDARKES